MAMVETVVSYEAIAMGGGHTSPIVIAAVIVFIVIVGIITLLRLRRGGPGPSVNWVPRRFRGKINDDYEKHGWQKPYDDDGNRNPDRDQL